MKSDAGNALFLILIAVALFAALSYAVTSSGRGSGSIDRERADIIAAEIMQYGATIHAAIQRLKLINGCLDTEISFDNASDPVGRYANPNSPADNSCHVFDPAGGGISWRDTPDSIKMDANYGVYRYSTNDMGAGTPVNGFGSDNADLYLKIQRHGGAAYADQSPMFLPVCRSINRYNNVPSIGANWEELPTFYSGALNFDFVGTFNDSGSESGTGSSLSKAPAFCAYNTPGYAFIVVPLLLR